jgi:hypothetical protein
MKDKTYQPISIPIELYEQIEKYISANPFLGYKTVPEFIKDSIRRRLEELKESDNRKDD